MRILAIDLGKAKSVACIFDSLSQTHAYRTVVSTPQAFHDLLTDPSLAKVDRVVIEVCDMAGWVVDLCRTLSLAIEVANANGEGWRWKNVKNKTDRTDSLKLARLCANGELSLVHIPERNVRHWRSLILYRHKLVERRTAIRNSIHALLVREGRSMMGREVWKEESMAALRKLARPIGECKADQLWNGHLHLELSSLDHLAVQISALDQKLNELGDAHAQVRRLQTIPGVGPRLSELVVAMIDDPRRFDNAREVGSYAGLVPRRYQSGEMDRSGRISKTGCGTLRKLLVEIAWGMLQHNPHGQGVFQRISKGQKSRRKQAAVALARRVLGWCWAMMRDQTDWKSPAGMTG